MIKTFILLLLGALNFESSSCTPVKCLCRFSSSSIKKSLNAFEHSKVLNLFKNTKFQTFAGSLYSKKPGRKSFAHSNPILSANEVTEMVRITDSFVELLDAIAKLRS